jgi:membrane-associated phospholipid phosphatase
MTALTDFGDAALLLPLAVAIALWLLARRPLTAAIGWLAALGLCMGGTALLKIYFLACPLGDFASPSGHVSFSVLVYGGLAVILGAAASTTRRSLVIAAVIAAATGLIIAIALSRLILGAHSPAEAAGGLAIGAGSLILFARAYLPCPPASVPLRPLVLAMILLVALFHGRQLHAEALFRAIGWGLGVSATCR